MQQPYVGNEQFNQYQQQQQYGMPPAPTVDQQQIYGQVPMMPPGQQQIGNQSNMVQVPNQQYSQQQPIVITQAGGKKKKKTGQKILNALIVALAVILVVGIIALTIMQCKQAKEKIDAENQAKEQLDAKNQANEASEQNAELQKPELTRQQPKLIIDKSGGELDGYTAQSVNNNVPTNNLDTINQSQSQSTSVGG